MIEWDYIRFRIKENSNDRPLKMYVIPYMIQNLYKQ